MADIRIKDLATTAASTASDDFIAVDGSANGTRKLNAYSPTFGGNVTVSGALLSHQTGVLNLAYEGSSISQLVAYGADASTYGRANIVLRKAGTGVGAVTALSLTSTDATVAGNLTVSGTGVSSVAGNFLVGTTTDNGAKTTISRTGAAPATSGSTSNATLRVVDTSNNIALDFGVDPASPYAPWIQACDRSNLATNYPLSLQRNGGNVLIGTNTNSGALLQVGTDTTTSAGGMIFGTDTSLYRIAAGKLAGPSAFTDVTYASSGVFFGANLTLGANDNIYLKTNGSITALTLDSSQNATFAGTITSGLHTINRDGYQIELKSINGGNPRAIRFTEPANTKFNWQVGAQINNDNYFEITPSTAAGGSTFTAPAFQVAGGSYSSVGLSLTTTGATFAGTVLVNTANPKIRWKDTSNTQDVWQASVDNDATQGWNLINNTSGYGTVMRFSRLGALRLNNYGAGTLTTDASGNVTASSDARLKTNVRAFARGLIDVIKLNPKSFNWNETSGLDTSSDYVGFVAQDVANAIPEAVYEGKDNAKMLTLNDRAILAAVVNAIKELNAKIA